MGAQGPHASAAPAGRAPEALPTRQLRARALQRAVRERDVRFLWRLVQAGAAAGAQDAQPGESEYDAPALAALLGDAEPAAGERMRAHCVEYLCRHPDA